MVFGRNDSLGDKKLEIHYKIMGLLFFKNTVLLIVFATFSCGSNSTNTNLEDNGSLNEYIEIGKDVKDDAKRDVERAEKKAEKATEDSLLKHKGKPKKNNSEIIVGAEKFHLYSELLKGKNVGVVANQTSIVHQESERAEIYAERNTPIIDAHLVDFLLSKNISVKKVFAPEHGFRGEADAGEKIKDGIDSKTGIPIISLYGNNKKPSLEQLKGIDILVFDIQDVGARFYTYISTLAYVMEACAEAGIPVIVLDRPNPNAHYIDGPILEKEYQSFVGMHPVPVIYGMTIGEYATMINGEGWLNNQQNELLKKKLSCDLTIIKMENYTHQTPYSLPIKPSPNLPNDQAINLYPSLCFFEGTFISAGRGTDKQFQVFGAPSLPKDKYTFSYTPQSNEGAKSPKFKGEKCYGKDLRKEPKMNRINLEWLIDAYNSTGNLPAGKAGKKDFFNNFFTNLAGTKKLQLQIEQGLSAAEIRATWAKGLSEFGKVRAKYLLYE